MTISCVRGKWVLLSNFAGHDLSEANAKRQNALLKAINRIFEEALSTSTEKELGQLCLSIAEQLTQSKMGFIGEINSNCLQELAISSTGSEACRVIDSTGHTLPPENLKIHGLYGRVLTDGRGFFTNDLAKHPDSIDVPKGHPPLNSFLGVPLKRENKTIGMIAVCNRDGGYMQDDLDSLEALAPAIVEAFARKRAEEALFKTKERTELDRKRLEVILETIPSAVVIIEATGEFSYLNHHAIELYGIGHLGYGLGAYAAKVRMLKPNGMPFPLDETPVNRSMKLGEEVRNVEMMIERNDGTQLPLFVSSAPIYSAAGQITAAVVVFEDISAHKKDEQALEENEHLYRTIFDNSEDGFQLIELIYDENGNPVDQRFLKVNKAYERQTGLKATDLIGRRIKELFPNLEDFWFEAPDNVLKTGRPIKTEGYNRDSQRWYESYFFPYSKNTVGALFTDITERKNAEAQIREQADLLDNANDAIIVVNLENIIMYWNKGAERLYGWKSAEVLGKNAANVLQNDPALIANAFNRATSSGEWIGEIKQKTKEGRDIIVESHLTFVLESRQKPKSIMAVNTDITEKKHLEAQYFRAQRLESIGTLAGGIAHDFRNMLTPIMVALDLFDQHLTTKEDHEMIAMLEKNVQRGADLTKQLLTFAKGTEGERISISVPALIFEVESTIRETFPKSISIDAKVDQVLPALIGDVTQLHQVLINLCLNARDAMPFGGTLSITAENATVDQRYASHYPDAKAGSYVVISVNDSGIGMPPEVLEKLFEPFFTTKKPGEGTGLGLSTARSIVKSHGGFITVHSEVGKGSTFRIYLPIGDVKGNRHPEKEPSNPMQGNGKTILIVDDEELIRATAIAALESHGYQVLEARDGAEALGVYIDNKDDISLVLVDMLMPIMDGEATIRALKRINPNVRVIGMSGLSENVKYKELSTIVGAFIAKPFTIEALLGAIARTTSGKNES